MFSIVREASDLLQTSSDRRFSHPFSSDVMEVIGCGFNDTIYELDHDHVVRVPRFNRKKKELLAEKDHFDSMRVFLHKFLPEVLFIWGEPINGANGYCVVPWIEGKTLNELTDEEYFELKDQLVDLIQGVLFTMWTTGEIVDFSGNPGWNLTIIRRSINIVVVEEKGFKKLKIRDFGRGLFLVKIPGIRELTRHFFKRGLLNSLKELNEQDEP